ncbi:MAG: N-acetylglucosamine-6-phosphate deacetylase [Anaerolineales bacterium]|nr:N-acetylglucosamine-6-phosphate deacetylase [Anaerolineales bacterium]
MAVIFENATVFTPLEINVKQTVIVSDEGTIDYAGPKENSPRVKGDRLDLCDRILAPGFIDIHRHGGIGINFGPGDNIEESLGEFAQWVAREGITGFLCSIAAPDEETLLETIKAFVVAFEGGIDGAEPLGIHLEGPYLNRKEKKGAFNPDWLRDPSLEEAEKMLEAGKGWIRQMTMDPALSGAHEVGSLFREAGVVLALGHTNTDYQEAREAIQSQYTHVTHTFNVMKGFHHREPGALGAVLASDRVTAELIPDAFHVHPGAMKVLVRCLGKDRIVVITDAIAGSGMADGEYDLVGNTVIVKDGQCRLKDGTIAGCATPYNRCVEIINKQVDVPLLHAVQMSTLNPARAMGFADRLGSITVGKDASLVVIDEDVNVYLTIVKGNIVFNQLL